MNAIKQTIKLLLSSSGLELNQAKLGIYYAIATWKLPHLDKFPISRLWGPPGTGKTKTMEVIGQWCYKPKNMNFDASLIIVHFTKDDIYII